MNISAILYPFYNSLIKVGFTNLIPEVSFNRIINKVGLTTSYVKAFNEANKPENLIKSFLGTEVSYEFVLLGILEDLYSTGPDEFGKKITVLFIECLPFLPFQINIDEILTDFDSLASPPQYLENLKIAWQKLDLDYQRKAEYFYNLILNRGVNNGGNPEHYTILRALFLKHPQLNSLLPQFIVNNVTEHDFWEFIKGQGGYKDRRTLISESFAHFREMAKNIANVPHSEMMKDVHVNIDQSYINETWKKALIRLNTDPEAAITSSRTLIEAVCKYILDTLNVSYDDSLDLPKLYKLTATQLNLSPEGHTEQIFKQILSGCSSVIDGLGSLRNKHSDAHGTSYKHLKPSARHAQLAVNLSGSMCTFLLETLEFVSNKIGL